ncbi:uncharacterized protein Tco025E_03954 [Trypanosoma conorhini]|uniref:RNA-editing substrate-binding complex 6 protein domain-containing protein n=1 Tax=Trypanosoma conorhini TaxID=83891 RepID=A0A422PQF2_9TRYP|nr:uncharacterized protein Tco025E_03954 [Trypanosoma conorhini]RNF19963.1 hypothetical protein Tco025E_03954 [Trypanosoma conorhini]
MSVLPSCLGPVGWGALHHSKRFVSTKLARLYTMELNKARSDYRRTPTRMQQEECLRIVTGTPLHCIQGLDGKTVAHCLSTLVILDAPRDLAMLHDCAVWLSVHPDAFSLHSLAQSLYSLVCLEYPDTATVLRAVQDRVLAAANDMAPSSLCMLLASVLTATIAADGAAQGPVDLSNQLTERLLRAVNEGLGVTEKVMIAVALGKLLGQASTSGVLSSHLLSQLSAAVWVSIPGAELSVISLADLVGLFSALHTAPPSIRELAEAALLEELKLRVEKEPLVSARSAVLMARVLKLLVKSSSPVGESLREAVGAAIEAYIASDAAALDTTTKLLAELADVGEETTTLISPSLQRYLVQAINERREKWSAESVHVVLRVFNRMDAVRADAQALATQCVDVIQAKRVAGAPVSASDIAALLVEGIVDPHAEVLASAVASNIDRWSVSNVLTFLRAASEVSGKPTRAIMRDVASKLMPYIEKATAAQVAAVIASYGRARVRNDAFCAAITNRAAVLSAELTLYQVGTILGGLAAVEYRDTKLFVDLAPLVVAHAPTADATLTANLLAAYSKMLIWNFRVIWSLAERAAVIHEQLSIPQALAVVMSLNRMDVQHQELMNVLLQKVMRYASDNATLSITEAVMILSAFSRSGVWDVGFFETLGKRIVRDQQQLTPDELAETLMSFARVGLAKYNIFEELTLRALAMAPTSPLMPLAHITVAYAIVGCRHEELFSIIADRFVNQKAEIPAVTIASVLSAFASIGIRNDRLFIESIPRVRHVGQYGTPKDITNVVYAYAQVGLWHYKLFVRLADRAIQLRGEFRCDHLARLLEAYARVDMRYEKLFVEFSPRIQTIAHLLTAGEVAKIVAAYAKVRMPDVGVFNACGDRAVEVVDSFELEEAQQVLKAFRTTRNKHDGLMASFATKFPEAVAALPPMEAGAAEENDKETEVDGVDLGSVEA